MGSLREEMQKVIYQWNQPEQEIKVQPTQPQPQPQPQITQPEVEAAAPTDEKPKRINPLTGLPMGHRGAGTFAYEVTEFIRANPGLNGMQIRDAMMAKFSNLRMSQTSSTLKQLVDNCTLTRRETHEGPVKTFLYEAVPVELREALYRQKSAKEKAARDRAAKARAALAEKRAKAKAALEARQLRAGKMPTQQQPLALTEAPKAAQPAPQPTPQPASTSSVQIRLTLTISGQDVRVTVPEAIQLHRQLAEFLGLGG